MMNSKQCRFSFTRNYLDVKRNAEAKPEKSLTQMESKPNASETQHKVNTKQRQSKGRAKAK